MSKLIHFIWLTIISTTILSLNFNSSILMAAWDLNSTELMFFYIISLLILIGIALTYTNIEFTIDKKIYFIRPVTISLYFMCFGKIIYGILVQYSEMIYHGSIFLILMLAFENFFLKTPFGINTKK